MIRECVFWSKDSLVDANIHWTKCWFKFISTRGSDWTYNLENINRELSMYDAHYVTHNEDPDNSRIAIVFYTDAGYTEFMLRWM